MTNDEKMTKNQAPSVNGCAFRHSAFVILSSCGPRPSSFPRRPGISRLEIVVLLLIALVLVSVLITYLGRQRGLADEKACANNLRHIGQAILGYHEEKKFLPAA